jgi:nucleoside-diphosphate-sugar epimerase
VGALVDAPYAPSRSDRIGQDLGGWPKRLDRTGHAGSVVGDLGDAFELAKRPGRVGGQAVREERKRHLRPRAVVAADLDQHRLFPPAKPMLAKSRVRDFVYIDDVVAAWRLAVETPVSGTFNLGSGRPTEVHALIAELLAACGLDDSYPIRQLEPTPGDQFTVWADVTAIREALGWEPKISLREGVARMVAWAQARQGEGC